jgi:hypothetical protein
MQLDAVLLSRMIAHLDAFHDSMKMLGAVSCEICGQVLVTPLNGEAAPTEEAPAPWIEVSDARE